VISVLNIQTPLSFFPPPKNCRITDGNKTSDSMKTEKEKLLQIDKLQLLFLTHSVPSELSCGVFFRPIIDIFKALCTKNSSISIGSIILLKRKVKIFSKKG
jgi:hypothetical protein